MTLFRSLLESRARKEGPYSLSDNGVTSFLGLQPDTASGIHVSEQTAMSCTNVFACVRVISEALSSVPLHLYERMGEGKVRAVDHPLYPLLHDAPNPIMTSMVYREAAASHILLWGNHYAWAPRDKAGKVRFIRPLHPDRVSPEFAGNSGSELVYRFTRTGGDEDIPRIIRAEEMVHVPGLSFNGLVGMSVVEANRETIGFTMAASQFAAEFFGNGAVSGATIKSEKPLSPEAKQRIKTSLEGTHQGLGKRFRAMVLDGGLDISWPAMPLRDYQFLEQRQYQVEEVARIFRVPLVLLQAPEKGAHYGEGIEQLMIGFVVHTLRPYFVRIEQELNRKLLSESERKRYFVEHNVDALLRGDLKSRYEAYVQGRSWGWLSVNDIRRIENMDPIGGDAGEQKIVPANYVPLDKLGEMVEANIEGKKAVPAAPAPADGPDGSEDQGSREALQWILERHLGQLVGRQVTEVRKALVERDAAGFLKWLDSRYGSISGMVEDFVGPTLEAVALKRSEGDAAEWARGWCKRYAIGSRAAILAAIRASVDRDLDRKTVIENLMDEWTEKRAQAVASVVFEEDGNAEAA